MADSIPGGDWDTIVGVRMVVMVGTILVTMVVIEAMVAEVTGVKKEMVGRAEMNQTAMEEAVMGRSYTIDVNNLGM